MDTSSCIPTFIEKDENVCVRVLAYTCVCIYILIDGEGKGEGLGAFNGKVLLEQVLP